MEKLYNDAKDKNVSATYIYGKSSDTKAYADSGCTIQMKTSELKEAFLSIFEFRKDHRDLFDMVLATV